MATITSHTLNGVDGTHAGGIGVTLTRIAPDGGRVPLFQAEMDEGGRLSQEVDLSKAGTDDRYELVFATGAYWDSANIARTTPQILGEVVIRLSMPDPGGRYHIPIILSPNSYSVWWSS